MKIQDIYTTVAISAFAWISLIISHEVLGHGGAAYLNGGKLAYFDTMFARYLPPEGGYTFWQSKFNVAAGSLLNIIMMIVAAIWFLKKKARQDWLGFGLWVFVLYAAFQGGCYIGFSQFIYKTMDWHKFLVGLQPQWLWRSAELAVGIALIGFGCWFGRKYHYEFIFPNQPIKTQKIGVFITPWLTASIISTAAAIFVPTDNRGLIILGGMGNSFNFLIFMPLLALIPTRKLKNSHWASLDRNIPVIIVGSLLVILYIFVFSRGIDLT